MKIKPVNNNPILIVDPDSPTAWMAEGNCRMYPPDMFFPSDGAGVERAKKVCADCPVASQCLEHALDARIDHGVWGGTSERQRRRILRERAIQSSGKNSNAQ